MAPVLWTCLTQKTSQCVSRIFVSVKNIEIDMWAYSFPFWLIWVSWRSWDESTDTWWSGWNGRSSSERDGSVTDRKTLWPKTASSAHAGMDSSPQQPPSPASPPPSSICTSRLPRSLPKIKPCCFLFPSTKQEFLGDKCLRYGSKITSGSGISRGSVSAEPTLVSPQTFHCVFASASEKKKNIP